MKSDNLHDALDAAIEEMRPTEVTLDNFSDAVKAISKMKENPMDNPLISDVVPCDQLTLYEQFVDSNWTGGSHEYTMIALAGEVGEACNFHKKGMRDPGFGYDPKWKERKIEELGDLLYYLVRAAHDEGVTLSTLMINNQKKLLARNKADR